MLIPLQQVTVQFVWRPMSREKRDLFTLLNSFFDNNPQFKKKQDEAFDAVTAHLNELREAKKLEKAKREEAKKEAAKNARLTKTLKKAQGTEQAEDLAETKIMELTQELYEEFVKNHYGSLAKPEEEQTESE